MEGTLPINQSLIRTMTQKNRTKTKQSLIQNRKDIAIYHESNRQKMRNKDTDLLFRQDSNFLYLTGVDIPSCVFYMDGYGETLFVTRLDEKDYTWHGAPVSNASLSEKYGLEILYVDEFAEFLAGKIAGGLAEVLVVDEPKFVDVEIFDKVMMVFEELEGMMNDVRAVKNEEEIELITSVCELSSKGHDELMKMSRPGLNEFHYESLFRYYTSSRGCRHQAYIPIVGSGPLTAILHYVDNNRDVNDGDLVLIDAGAEFLGYASDITRTFPANGKFSPDQRLIYNMVLQVQKTLIDELKPGLNWRELSLRAQDLLIDSLIENDFVYGEREKLVELSILRNLFMPHGLGHHIGLDVHDSTIFPDDLEPGMIVTIEPGIYFNPVLVDRALADPELSKVINTEKLIHFRDFGGVRIEDDILITPEGHICLTTAAKEIDEIESLMKQ